MNIQEIIKEINNLPLESRVEVYNQLGAALKRIHQAQVVLEKFKGRGKNILGLEPQEYINKLRSDERI